MPGLLPGTGTGTSWNCKGWKKTKISTTYKNVNFVDDTTLWFPVLASCTDAAATSMEVPESLQVLPKWPCTQWHCRDPGQQMWHLCLESTSIKIHEILAKPVQINPTICLGWCAAGIRKNCDCSLLLYGWVSLLCFKEKMVCVSLDY